MSSVWLGRSVNAQSRYNPQSLAQSRYNAQSTPSARLGRSAKAQPKCDPWCLTPRCLAQVRVLSNSTDPRCHPRVFISSVWLGRSTKARPRRSAKAQPRYNHRPSTPSVRLGRSTEARLRYNPRPSTPSTTLGWLGSTVLKQETTPAMIPVVLFYGGEGSFLMVIGGVAIRGGVVTPTTEPTPAPASESLVGVEVPQRLPLATLIGPLVRGPDPTTVVSLGPLPSLTLEPSEEVASRHLASPL
ncbi:hypothetical protein B296_00057696 [Ensete ventricosum]|uniref:Uncharacterized protein n=1 Tax=Ensete ventricosum TaxID=4639 RepID=A0A426X3M2_ENSVE|nr:hypothetical protein B296_00057696 [Ensete ventricosum]